MSELSGLPVGWALAVMASTAIATAGWIAWARSRAIEDAPGGRRVHVQRTVRGGGVGILVGMGVAAALWLYGARSDPAGAMHWVGPGIAVALFALVGLLDDVRPLAPAVKLAGQGVAALVGTAFLLQWPGFASAALVLAALVGWIGTVNLWNFMDGSNGMVTLQAMLVGAAMALWPGASAELRWVAVGLAAACAGFLPFNFPHARVFLGDVGSHLLGAAVFLLLATGWREGILSLPQAGLVVSAMAIDGGLTLVRRAWRRRPIWRAHREHLYQYAVRRGHSHAAVALAYAGWTAAATMVAVSTRGGATWAGGAALAVVVIAGTLCHGALRRRWLQRPDKEIRA